MLIIYIGSGIWDCLTLQQGVDFVRYHVSKGMTLSEICEMMCDYCLHPNNQTSTMNFTIGLDNTTVIIVAILHGRTKEEWYAWVTDRVENTGVLPDIPQLYSASELKSFKELVEVEWRVRELGLENADNNLTTL
jgi:protein phosphatase PTC2/3